MTIVAFSKRLIRTMVPSTIGLARLLTFPQWVVGTTTGIASAALLFRYYSFISGWIGVGIAVVVITAVYLHYAPRAIIPFPQFAILIPALQCIFAACRERCIAAGYAYIFRLRDALAAIERSS